MSEGEDPTTSNAALDAVEVRLSQVGHDIRMVDSRIARAREEISNSKATLARLYTDRDTLTDAMAKLRAP